MADPDHAGAAARSDVVKSAARVLDLLELLSLEDAAIGVTAVAERMRIPKSSAQGLLMTLVSRGYAVREGADYRLATELRGTWIGGLRGRLLHVARPVMRRMADDSGESAFLSVLQGEAQVRYLAKEVSTHEVRYDASLEPLRPAHATSSGLAILAFSSADVQTAFFAGRHFEAVTPATVIDPAALRKTLAQVRRDGFAEIRDANVVGASGVSAPVLDTEGRVIAALNLGAPTWRYDEVRSTLIELVRREAARLTTALERGGKAD